MGTPRPDKVTKADFQTLRKHGKYHCKAYNKLGPNNTYDLPLTVREALRYEKISSANGWTFKLERGDLPEEDPLIDGRLMKFELGIFRRIRRGEKARRTRLAAGENQDESDFSDDDTQ